MSAQERLLKACEAMRDDLLMRADIDSDGTRAVNVSNSKWEEFNDAIDAPTAEHPGALVLAKKQAAEELFIRIRETFYSLQDDWELDREHLVSEALSASTPKPASFDLVKHLHRQRSFSQKTFGPGTRTKGVLDHLRKELSEVSKNPSDVTEWIDIVLLALDGAWRAGHTPEEIAAALEAKQSKNESRSWPDWRQSSPNQAIEHLDENAHPMMGKVVRYGPGVTALFRVESTNAHTSRRDRSKSYRLYGAHVLGGVASAHEDDVTVATRADLAIWAEKKGLEIDLTIDGQTIGRGCGE